MRTEGIVQGHIEELDLKALSEVATAAELLLISSDKDKDINDVRLFLWIFEVQLIFFQSLTYFISTGEKTCTIVIE